MFVTTTLTSEPSTEETKFFPSADAAIEFAERKVKYRDVYACWVHDGWQTIWDMDWHYG